MAPFDRRFLGPRRIVVTLTLWQLRRPKISVRVRRPDDACRQDVGPGSRDRRVIIVNWNGGTCCVSVWSRFESRHSPADRMVVVDNASTDDSLARAESELRDVQLIRLPDNKGFAEANNIGARAAGSVALALLNPDAVAEPRWLAQLVRAAEREPTVAAFASQIRLASAVDYLDGAGDSYHVSGRAWRNGHRIRPRTNGPRPTAKSSPHARRRRSTGGRPSTISAASIRAISAISRTWTWAFASGFAVTAASTSTRPLSITSAPH